MSNLRFSWFMNILEYAYKVVNDLKERTIRESDIMRSNNLSAEEKTKALAAFNKAYNAFDNGDGINPSQMQYLNEIDGILMDELLCNQYNDTNTHENNL